MQPFTGSFQKQHPKGRSGEAISHKARIPGRGLLNAEFEPNWAEVILGWLSPGGSHGPLLVRDLTAQAG